MKHLNLISASSPAGIMMEKLKPNYHYQSSWTLVTWARSGHHLNIEISTNQVTQKTKIE